MASIDVSAVPGLCNLNLPLDPLLRQVSYVFCVGKKVKVLEEKMEELKSRSNDLKNMVEEAESRNTERRTEEVAGLLNKVRETDTKMRAIRSKYDNTCKCFGRYSGSVIFNYTIGRKVAKMLEEVKELHEDLGRAMTSASIRTLPVPSLRQQSSFPSNPLAIQPNLSKVLSYLAEGVAVVGIYGMGGVGKSTLLNSIKDYLINGNASSDAAGGREVRFQHVIWAVASRGNDDLRKDIAEKLKVEQSEISNFLENKKFVLLLDDVWERVDLGAIGIPTRGRTVVLTTRSEDVCGNMDANKKVKVECLEPEDSWNLFKEKVGDDVIKGDPMIEELARKIAKECGGLPLALVTIGRAMSSKKTANEWEHSLTLLEKSNWTSAVRDAEKKLLSLLSYSYDNLGNDIERKCFLCCALFPEDYEIPKDKLIDCFLGHGLLDTQDLGDIGEIYNYGHALIGNLKSACLLESSDREESVKMHDIVRDMALWIVSDRNNDKWIVSKEQWKGVNDWELANRISITRGMITFLEPKRKCPYLSTLMIRENHDLETIPPKVFQYFPALTYLDLSYVGISELPKDVTRLVHLQYLNLSYSSIKSLSKTLSKLAKLKYLILTFCLFLEHVEPGLISSFTTLQVLDLFGGNTRFIEPRYYEDGNQYLINMEELKSLKKIKALGLYLALSECSTVPDYVNLDTICKLDISKSPMSESKDTLVLGKNIQDLIISNCLSLEELTIKRSHDFHWLDRIFLSRLSHLRMIRWQPEISQATFPQLTTIQIGNCHKLKNLAWIRHVSCLTHLNVDECKQLMEIIPDEADDGQTSSIFPNLRSILLRELPALRNIYSGTIDCTSLERIFIKECRSLERLPFSFQSHIANNKSLSIGIEPLDKKIWEGFKWANDNIKSYLEQFIYIPEERYSDSTNYENGMEATDMLERMKDLFENLGGTMDIGSSLTAQVPSSPGQESPSSSNSLAIESNLSTVLGYLADGVAVVGIFGMGGVGKTTLLEKINNNLIHGNANSDNAGGREVHFQHVIWAVVSRGKAGLKESQEAIAAQLNVEPTAITNFLENKKFVLLLDDIWERVDLDAIGVPTQGRTVVFTTRSEAVCDEMDANEKVKVECLSEADAWQLFKEEVGDDIIKGDPRIGQLAREVTKKCGGLPLALITIGRAMSSKTTTIEWEYVLTSLKKSNWTSVVPDAELFRVLSYSYDNLVNDAERQCFLCCALFPEGSQIDKDEKSFEQSHVRENNISP